MMKIDNYYLDLNKVSELKSNEEKEKIHSYYYDLLSCFSDGRSSMGNSIFYTLYKAGYLRELRDDKINQVLS